MAVVGFLFPWVSALVFLLMLISGLGFIFAALWVGQWSAAWVIAYRRAGRGAVKAALLGLLAFVVMLLLGYAEVSVWDWLQHDQAE